MNRLMMRRPVPDERQPLQPKLDLTSPLPRIRNSIRKCVVQRRYPQRRQIPRCREVTPEPQRQLSDHLAVHHTRLPTNGPPTSFDDIASTARIQRNMIEPLRRPVHSLRPPAELGIEGISCHDLDDGH